MGDVDGDGISDFPMNSGFANKYAAVGQIAVVSSRTGKLLMTVRSPGFSAGITRLSRRAAGVGDADGDGRPDIAYGIIAHVGQAQVVKVRVVDALTGELTFESKNLRGVIDRPISVVARAGDLNGDGRDDVACCLYDFSVHAPLAGALMTFLAPQ